MRQFLFFCFFAFLNPVLSQVVSLPIDTLKIQKHNTYSILIDSAKLNKYRELTASNAIIFETSNLSLNNLPDYYAVPAIRIRGNSDALFTLNGVPLKTIIPDVTIFNIESIEISTDVFNKGTNFLDGSINLSTIKPTYNHKPKVNYEGNMTMGNAQTNSNINLYSNLNGRRTFYTNSISLEKGWERYAARISYSNSFSKIYGIRSSRGNNIWYSSNSFGVDLKAKPFAGFSINSNFYYTSKNLPSGFDEIKTQSSFLFGNISGQYSISESLRINAQIASMNSTSESLDVDFSDPLYLRTFLVDVYNCTPFYGCISIDKLAKPTEKSNLESTLGYSYLVTRNNMQFYSPSSTTQNIYGSLTFDYSNIVKIRASISNEFYKDDSLKNNFYLVPTVDLQINLFRLSGINEMKKTCHLFASYTSSNRNNNYFNIKQKFETGIKTSFLSKRIGLDLAYYTTLHSINFRTNSTAFIQELYFLNPIELNYDLLNRGIELKNIINIIGSKRTNWNLTNCFGWNRTIYSNEKIINNFPVPKDNYPEFRYSLSSDFSYKSMSIGLLFDGINNHIIENYYFDRSIEKIYRNYITFRQINLSYIVSEEKLKNESIKQIAISAYFKNFFTNSDNSYYGITGSSVTGLNVRFGF